MNEKQFRYVITLSQEGSFSKAAAVLNISQPSLSQYVKKIEDDIGREIFSRENGCVKLTDAGKVYVDIGRQMLALEHQMEVRLSDIAENKSGSLIIGTAPYRAASMLPPIAKRFQELHSGMHLIVREGTTTELTEGMEHGEYDMALTLLPIDSRLFCYEKVAAEELVLAVPKSHPEYKAIELSERKYPAVDVAVLNGQRLVMLTDKQFMQKQLDNIRIDYELLFSPAAVVKSIEAQIEMVKAGVGMAVMPTGVERFCSGNEVRFYSFAQNLPKREVAVMWRRDRELSEAAKELKSIIHDIQW